MIHLISTISQNLSKLKIAWVITQVITFKQPIFINYLKDLVY